MHRFFVSPANIANGTAVIEGDELRHLARVLRLGVGDAIVVFDGQEKEYRGVIRAIDGKEVLVSLEASIYADKESPLELWLVQGIAKGDKMEFIIQKATELGVRGIIPLETERTVVRLTDEKREEREARWQKVALGAVKQCGRTRIPSILPCRKIPEFLAGLPHDKLLLVPWEKGGNSLKKVLQERVEGVPVYLLIGPEGGLEEKEVAQVKEYGGIPLTLGPRILRTETAGLAVIASIMYQWGDLG